VSTCEHALCCRKRCLKCFLRTPSNASTALHLAGLRGRLDGYHQQRIGSACYRAVTSGMHAAERRRADAELSRKISVPPHPQCTLPPCALPPCMCPLAALHKLFCRFCLVLHGSFSALCSMVLLALDSARLWVHTCNAFHGIISPKTSPEKALPRFHPSALIKWSRQSLPTTAPDPVFLVSLM